MSALTQKARGAFDKGEYVEALDLYSRSVADSPDDIPALVGVAKSLYRLNRMEEVIETCQKILKLNPNLPVAHVLLADAYDECHELEKSREEARKAYTLDPNDAEALTCYGTYLLDDGELDESIPILEKAAAVNDNLYLIHHNLATAYARKKDSKGVLRELRKMYHLRPSFDVGFKLAVIYMDKISFFNIVGLVFSLAIVGALIFKAWEFWFVAAFCIVFLVCTGIMIRRLSNPRQSR